MNSFNTFLHDQNSFVVVVVLVNNSELEQEVVVHVVVTSLQNLFSGTFQKLVSGTRHHYLLSHILGLFSKLLEVNSHPHLVLWLMLAPCCCHVYLHLFCLKLKNESLMIHIFMLYDFKAFCKQNQKTGSKLKEIAENRQAMVFRGEEQTLKISCKSLKGRPNGKIVARSRYFQPIFKMSAPNGTHAGVALPTRN